VPRVLIAGFCAVPGPTRAGVQLLHIVRALSRHNPVDVLVVRTDDQPYVERMGNARILRVPIQEDTPRKRVAAFRRAVRRQLEGAEYDVVHFRDGWSGIPVLEMRERLRYAAVFDAARAPMSEPQLMSIEMSAELARDEEASLLAADLVLAPTERAAEYIAARGRPDRVFTVPPGVDIDLFDYEHNTAAGPPRILYAGALAPGRGVRILLRSVFDLVGRTDARLLIACPSILDFDKRLRSAIDDLRVGGRVQLLGPIQNEDVPALISSAAICVAPAAVDLGPKPTALYPTKILEYMACRRVVVAPRRGTVGMLMRDGAHGLLFTPSDPADLTLKLMRLLGNPALREKLAASGYELVRQNHTASGTRRALRRAYAALSNMSPWRERFSQGWDGLPVQPPTTTDSDPSKQTADDIGVTTEILDRDLEEAGLSDEIDMEGRYQEVTQSTDEHTVPEGVTTVDHPHEQKWLDRAKTQPLVRLEDWVVSETGLRRAAASRRRSLSEEDEGTPVDVRPVPADTPPIMENRFVAGEIDLPTPPPETRDAVFSAVSVLLGGGSEDGDDTPTPTPVDRSDERRRLRPDDSDER